MLILADVFEEFRGVCMGNYGLDPEYYVSSQQLSWDAMLRNTNCTFDLITDREMFSMVQVGIRGGVSMIPTRYAQANNPDLTAFDPARSTSYIIYLDANNLFVWAMCQPMPIGGFEWMRAAEAREIDWLAQTEDQPMGYFIEASMNYPVELHEAHNDYPLAPERLDVQVKMLSENQVELRTHYKMSRSTH